MAVTAPYCDRSLVRRLRSTRFQVMIFSPMGLHENPVDLVKSYDLFAVADGFEHGGDAQIASSS